MATVKKAQRGDSLSLEHIIRIPAPAPWLRPFSSRCPCPFWPAEKGCVPASLIASQASPPPPPPRQCSLPPLNSGALIVCLPHLQPDMSSLIWIIIFYILSPEIGCESHPSRRIFLPFLKSEMSPSVCLSPNRSSKPSLDWFMNPNLSVLGDRTIY